eukprot:COSAG06_NODE_1132_length_10582_cov_5.539826_17_plen_179_part_00
MGSGESQPLVLEEHELDRDHREQRDEDMARCATGLGGARFSRMSFVTREVKVPDQFTMLAGLCARRTGMPGRRAGCSTRSCANAHGDCLQKKLWRNASIELLRAPRGPTLNPYRPRNTARRGVHLSWKCPSTANHTRSVVGPRLRRTATVVERACRRSPWRELSAQIAPDAKWRCLTA